ncbi:PIG-L family deacetylase [Candidatus Pelagibacter ubique]|nr:PIG-L family deacetylase [Candidatus Pelagibacter ubique]|tara:strand:- start:56 stop:727 length:672 start_codon:yes stop_codon:yes gene_type:complete
MNLDFKKTLVIAPHLDDETIALGGTIRKLSKTKSQINVIIVGGHLPPLYKKEDYQITKNESKKALKILGVKKVYYLDIPALEFHRKYYNTLNSKINALMNDFNPTTVFIPFPDRHIDHRTVFDCAMVNTRPNKKNHPKFVLSYETLSETHWNAPYIEANFTPDFFVNIDETIKDKIKALNCYQSQIKDNQSRSIQAVQALARFRGSQNGCKYAEGFKLIRAIV